MHPSVVMLYTVTHHSEPKASPGDHISLSLTLVSVTLSMHITESMLQSRPWKRKWRRTLCQDVTWAHTVQWIKRVKINKWTKWIRGGGKPLVGFTENTLVVPTFFYYQTHRFCWSKSMQHRCVWMHFLNMVLLCRWTFRLKICILQREFWFTDYFKKRKYEKYVLFFYYPKAVTMYMMLVHFSKTLFIYFFFSLSVMTGKF